jgi:hypothetical protein
VNDATGGGGGANLAPAALVSVLRECFHGAGEAGAFLDPGQGGLLALLASLSAAEASAPVAGASVARHALHVAFSLDVFAEWIGGLRDVEYDWAQSWARGEVDQGQWLALRERLALGLAALEAAVARHAARDAQAAWGAAGALAHTAYHLGMIQLKVDELRAAQARATSAKQ